MITPIVLQGLLEGLQNEPAIIRGSLNTDEHSASLPGAASLPRAAGLSNFLASIGQNISTENFESLVNFKSISLEALLTGLCNAIDFLVFEDGIGYKDLPIIDQSLVDLLGSGGTDFITGFKEAIDTVRASLADIQGTERGLNFEIEKALGLDLAMGDQTQIETAYDHLMAISFDLSSRSGDTVLAVALAKARYADLFNSLLADQAVALANDFLASFGLSQEATYEEIVMALADAALLTTLQADRDLVAADTDFMAAYSRLSLLGLTMYATDAEIEAALSKEGEIDFIKSLLDLLAQDTIGQFEQFLANNILSWRGLTPS